MVILKHYYALNVTCIPQNLNQGGDTFATSRLRQSGGRKTSRLTAAVSYCAG